MTKKSCTWLFLTCLACLVAIAFLFSADGPFPIFAVPKAAEPPSAVVQPRPTLPAVVAWDGFSPRSLCLEVSFPQINPKMGDVAGTVSEVLGHAGFEIRPAGASCEATLTISLAGEPVAASYGTYGATSGKRCYEGADVAAQIELSAPGHDSLTVRRDASRTPSNTIGENQCNTDPAEAPFHLAWQEAVLPGLTEIWGPSVLIPALGYAPNSAEYTAALDALRKLPDAASLLEQALASASVDIRRGASNALGETGHTAEMTPPVGLALSDQDYMVRANAVEALGRGTPDDAVVAALISALADPDDTVRTYAAEALGRIACTTGFSESPFAQAIVPALTQASENDASSGVRTKAISMLFCIENPAMCSW